MTALTARPLRVKIGNREVWRYEADADATVRWDATRGILLIDEPGVIEEAAAVTKASKRRRTARTAKTKKASRAKPAKR